MPRFRVFTWIILAVNAFALLYIILSAATRPGPTNCGTLSAQTCTDAYNAGSAIGIGLLIGLWVAADVILGIIWLITKPKTRDCPACGRNVKRGQMVCKKCGYNFAQAAQYGPPPQAGNR